VHDLKTRFLVAQATSDHETNKVKEKNGSKGLEGREGDRRKQ
jgi:hypothetical protein